MDAEETDAELEKIQNAKEDLQEVQTRLNKIIQHTSTKTYEGTDMISDAAQVEKDEKRLHEVSSDPFNDYGYGIIAYFNLQRFLMYTYILIACLAMWLMMQYNSGNALLGVDKRYFMFSRFSLGNLGSAKTECITQNIDFDNIDNNVLL